MPSIFLFSKAVGTDWWGLRAHTSLRVASDGHGWIPTQCKLTFSRYHTWAPPPQFPLSHSRCWRLSLPSSSVSSEWRLWFYRYVYAVLLCLLHPLWFKCIHLGSSFQSVRQNAYEEVNMKIVVVSSARSALTTSATGLPAWLEFSLYVDWLVWSIRFTTLILYCLCSTTSTGLKLINEN